MLFLQLAIGTIANVAGETFYDIWIEWINSKHKKEEKKENDKKEDDKNKNENEKNLKNFDPRKTFFDASNKAELSGKVLAYILASKLFLKHHNFTICGFSLGCHVTKH